jgi:hypothetical protein
MQVINHGHWYLFRAAQSLSLVANSQGLFFQHKHSAHLPQDFVLLGEGTLRGAQAKKCSVKLWIFWKKKN